MTISMPYNNTFLLVWHMGMSWSLAAFQPFGGYECGGVARARLTVISGEQVHTIIDSIPHHRRNLGHSDMWHTPLGDLGNTFTSVRYISTGARAPSPVALPPLFRPSRLCTWITRASPFGYSRPR